MERRPKTTTTLRNHQEPNIYEDKLETKSEVYRKSIHKKRKEEEYYRGQYNIIPGGITGVT